MSTDTWDRDELRDMLAEAISESVDLDWQPRDGAECVLARLEKEGLAIQPSMAAIAEEHALSALTVVYYTGIDEKPPLWEVFAHAPLTDCASQLAHFPDFDGAIAALHAKKGAAA